MWVSQVTGEACRRVGQWPTPETMAERLIEALTAAAESAPEEDKPALRKAAGFLATAGRDIVVGVLTSMATAAAAA